MGESAAAADGIFPAPLLPQHPATRTCDGAVWYTREITLPGENDRTRFQLTFTSPVGLLEVYLDERLLGKTTGIGLPYRLPFSGIGSDTHRLTLRLERRGLRPRCGTRRSAGWAR